MYKIYIYIYICIYEYIHILYNISLPLQKLLIRFRDKSGNNKKYLLLPFLIDFIIPVEDCF